MRILITGAAGFIGFHLAQRLIASGAEVTGIDNINDYYSTQLKKDRLKECGIDIDIPVKDNVYKSAAGSYTFIRMDLLEMDRLLVLFEKSRFEYVINLAAQAGIRYSMENPRSYIQSNIEGFFNLLECCRLYPPLKLIYASSSSVYGLNTEQPFAVSQKSETPINVYAASKKTNELLAHAYSHLYKFTTVGLRFFTVYGPWGRPDMAPYLFAESITSGRPIHVFNNGQMKRDFTYIDDIVDGLVSVIKTDLVQKYQVFNIGTGVTTDLLHFISCLEDSFGLKANKHLKKMAPGDLTSTCADTTALEATTGYKATTKLEDGVRLFAKWYKNYHELWV